MTIPEQVPADQVREALRKAFCDGVAWEKYGTIPFEKAVADSLAALFAPVEPKAIPGDGERGAVVALREHLREQITHAETRIQDGKELGASVWRIALEDIIRENWAVLSSDAGERL